MNRAYWDRLAKSYSDDVLEITAIDSARRLARAAASFGGRNRSAADFGCGVGATTRTFARHFEHVTGIDFSPQLLAEAARRTKAPNVTYVLGDLAAERPLEVEVDAGFCVNCLIAPRYETRVRIARAVVRSVRSGGAVVVVVPALESALRTYHALIRLDIADGSERRQGVRRVAALAKREVLSIVEGIVVTGGEPTKHYLGDEIAQFLADAGLQIDTLERVDYPWKAEIELGDAARRARTLLGERTPWDWLVIGRAP
jgi:SAM-dependent methyltransferase